MDEAEKGGQIPRKITQKDLITPHLKLI